MRLRPKVKLLTDFFVLDTETKVSYADWVEQRKNENPNFVVPKKKKGTYFGLSARPESFCFGVIYGLNYCKVFHNLKEMIEELKTERFRKKYVFAHNAIYDLTTMFGNVFHMDPNAVMNGSRFIMAKNGVCIFADSYNILATSVAKIGQMIGIAKPSLGDDYYSEEIDSGVINRCIVDCQIVWEGLLSIFEMAGDIKVTQASLSMTYFRRFHQKFDIKHNEKIGSHFWNSYYGGRTEAFKLGKVNGKVLDVNSMYPYAMKVCQFPNPLYLKHEAGISLKRLKFLMNAFEGLAYVTVRHKESWIGYLPLKKDGKLLFPVGKFSGCWNFLELRYGVESGIVEIISVDSAIYGERMESPFDKYVDYLYGKRLETTNDFDKFRIKIFMNSLYGKFAQRISEESIYIPDIELADEMISEYQRQGVFIELLMFNEKRKDAQLIIKSKKFSNLSYSIPLFSSYITSFARIMLLKKAIELKPKGVLYCDTDSLFISNDFGITNEYHLGGWKKENKIVTLIRGLKNYEYTENGKIFNRIKGVPEKAVQIATNSYEYFNMMKTREAMRQNKTPGLMTKRTKVLTGEYSKRIVYSDGTTTPIIL